MINILLVISFFAWTEPVQICDSLRQPGQSCIGAGSKRVYVAWREGGLARPSFIAYRWSEDGGISWSDISRSPKETWDPIQLYMVVDKKDILHLFYGEWGREVDIYWSFFNGDTWSDPYNVSDMLGHDYAPKAAIDSKNRLHLVWHQYGGSDGIWYRVCENGVWLEPQPVSPEGSITGLADIVIDSKDPVSILSG